MRYLLFNKKNYLFGCCSLTSQDPEEGLAVYDYLHEKGYLHPDIDVRVQVPYACELPAYSIHTYPDVTLPRLMKIYMNYRARICSKPAIDRLFKTIDYLVIFDVDAMDPQMFSTYFG